MNWMEAEVIRCMRDEHEHQPTWVYDPVDSKDWSWAHDDAAACHYCGEIVYWDGRSRRWYRTPSVQR